MRFPRLVVLCCAFGTFVAGVQARQFRLDLSLTARTLGAGVDANGDPTDCLTDFQTGGKINTTVGQTYIIELRYRIADLIADTTGSIGLASAQIRLTATPSGSCSGSASRSCLTNFLESGTDINGTPIIACVLNPDCSGHCSLGGSTGLTNLYRGGLVTDFDVSNGNPAPTTATSFDIIPLALGQPNQKSFLGTNPTIANTNNNPCVWAVYNFLYTTGSGTVTWTATAVPDPSAGNSRFIHYIRTGALNNPVPQASTLATDASLCFNSNSGCTFVGCCDMLVDDPDPAPGQTVTITVRGGANSNDPCCSPYRLGGLSGTITGSGAAAPLPASAITGQALLGFLGEVTGSAGAAGNGPSLLTGVTAQRACHTGGPGAIFGTCPPTSSNDDMFRFKFTVPAGTPAGTTYTFNFAGQANWIDAWIQSGNVWCPSLSAPVSIPGCSITVTVACGGAPNDSCTACTPIILSCANVTVNGTTVGACADGGSTCDGNTDPDVWYCLTARCAGMVTLTTCGSAGNPDTVISVHSACPGTAANEIACNDDDPGGCGNGLQSKVTFNATANTTYYVRVAGFVGLTAPFTLVASRAPCTPPSNDNCGNATVIGNVTNLPFSTCGATTDGPAGCNANNDIWYRYTATCTGLVRVDTSGSLFDTVLAVYCPATCPATTANQVVCNDNNGPVSPSSNSASVQFLATAGTSYFIRVGGNAPGVVGSGDLTVKCVAGASPSDLCANAQPVTTGVYQGTIVGATPTPGLTGMCGSSNNARDVWYSFSTCSAGQVTVDTCAAPGWGLSPFDTVVSVHSGCPGSGSIVVACNDDVAGCGTLIQGPPVGWQSRVTFSPVPCKTYLIRVSGWNGATGNFALTIVQAPVTPTNDLCANATTISSGPGSTNFSNCNATSDGPSQCVPSGRDVWFRWTATCIGPVTIDTFGSAFDTVLSVYPTGACPPTQASQLACNDDSGGTLQSKFTFNAASGTTYLIRIAGYGSVGKSGCGRLNINQAPPCPTCPPAGLSYWPGSVFTMAGPIGNPTVSGKWRIRRDCCFCFENCNFTATGITTIPQLVAALVADINGRVTAAGCGAPPALVATQPGGGVNFTLKVRCGTTPPPLVLEVGMGSDPCNTLCVVTTSNVYTNAPCQFNPFVEQMPESGLDCNGNEIDDLAEIVAGLVPDLDGNGVPDDCPGGLLGACCAGGGCIVTSAAGCAGSIVFGAGCGPDENPCGKQAGSCCAGSTCSVKLEIDCVGSNTRYAGGGSACNAPGNNTTPCCKANFNQAGAVTVQDLFDYLAAWFAQAPSANFNGAGGVTVQDLFDFLAAWFAGCP